MTGIMRTHGNEPPLAERGCKQGFRCAHARRYEPRTVEHSADEQAARQARPKPERRHTPIGALQSNPAAHCYCHTPASSGVPSLQNAHLVYKDDGHILQIGPPSAL